MNRLQLLDARCCSFGGAAMLATLAVPLVFALSALGQSSSSFDLSWHTADGGGVTSISSASFRLSGTIGQPDPGQMSGDTLVLTGGFWFGIVPGDCNEDGGVDLNDFADFAACLLGPGGGLGAGCACFDFDDSGDVDLKDFASLTQHFTGSQ